MTLHRHKVQHSGTMMTLLSFFVLLCMSVNAIALALCPHMLGGVCRTLQSRVHTSEKESHCASMGAMSISDTSSVVSNELVDASVTGAAVTTSPDDGCTHCIMQSEYGRQRTLNGLRPGDEDQKAVEVESQSTPIGLETGFSSIHIRDHDPPGLVVPIYVRIKLYRI
jgi:hypothetical protein